MVTTTRKLKPYFLPHKIIILTNNPEEIIMTHPNISRRLVKWIVELGECDIGYQTSNTIKAQALTYFLTEMVGLGQEKVWGYL